MGQNVHQRDLPGTGVGMRAGKAKPEAEARVDIDAALEAAGWVVQDRDQVNLHAARGVAVREFPLKTGFGFADYLLYVDKKAAGVVEAKKRGTTLTGVETQAGKYSEGMPANLPAHVRPLPFLYQSTGTETRFTNLLDPEPRSRSVFSFHRPETLAAWLAEERPYLVASDTGSTPTHSTLRHRLQQLPPIDPTGLRQVQLEAIQNLEKSLAQDRPRALVQMATGTGKTYFAVSEVYRLIKYGGANRVLFLVDRGNLAKQAENEFKSYVAPDDGRKLEQLYVIQRLTTNRINPVAKVVITTIQRLYSMLRGRELDEAAEDQPLSMDALGAEDEPIGYNPSIPIELFDVVFTDECHRSIYNLWRQVLEYFDAYLIGLTATPAKHTFGFFNQNLVMEYGHEQAVRDKVNVPFEVYKIRTEITERGARLSKGEWIDKRDRQTRKVRWEQLDDELAYDPEELDRRVVAKDQIRTVVRTFRDRLFADLFPERSVDVPKTIIFAKDDSHADDIVQIVREEFGKGNEFAKKITYRTTGEKPEDLIASFRNSYFPRIAVTVDMIATGTDIKPVEIVMFMRAVKSRNLFEQMKGRGVRVIDEHTFKAVTPNGMKDRFVLIDCVGVTDEPLADSQPLETKHGVSFAKLMEAVQFGTTDVDVASSLAARLTRIDRKLGPEAQARIQQAAGGATLSDLVRDLVDAINVDRHVELAKLQNKLPPGTEPTPQQVAKASEQLISEALKPLASSPKLRDAIDQAKREAEQIIDTSTRDRVLEAGFSADAKLRAQGLVTSFEEFIQQHKDEITALQVLYSRRYANRLRFEHVKELAGEIAAPPRSWTTEQLWRAYETLDKDHVRGASGKRLLTDVVQLVRFAIHQENELVPFTERVEANYTGWLLQQANKGRKFTPAQREWLNAIKDHVATSLKIEKDDFDDVPFNQIGGLGKVFQLFGSELEPLLEELNEVLVG